MEILPALQAAEQQGVFKRAAAHPYYLKKAAYNPDRPYENNDWGFCPPEKPKGNSGNYKVLQRRAKNLGINSFGMKGPELEAAVKEAENEQRQGESEAGSVPGHEGLQGQRGKVAQAAEGGPAGPHDTVLATPDQE